MSKVPDWAAAFSNYESFPKEQAQLSNVWTFLGFERDIPNINDWFKVTLGGRSIFVQQFEEGLRGFENICPHRFHPIRTAEKGSGPVVCGFHQWRYDACGQAIGIPKCKQMYGKLPKELNAYLPKVEVSLCGGLIWGRIGGGPSLQEWLGPGYDILNHLTADLELGGEIDFQVNAHWKLLMNISLDDYHSVAVHPTTFGKNGFLSAECIKYFRFGSHSSYVANGAVNAIETMAQECRERRFIPKKYTVFQFFPTLIVALVFVTNLLGDDYWYLLVQQLEPIAHNQTRSRSRFFLLPFNKSAGFGRRLVRKFIVPFNRQIFKYYSMKVHKEDNQVCENLQKVSLQVGANMILSNQEQRIGWFEEEYARYVLSKDDKKNEVSSSENLMGVS